MNQSQSPWWPLADNPYELLEQFRPGDAFFASPNIALLGRGTTHQCRTTDARPQTLETAAGHLFASARQAGQQAPIIMGLIPFDHDDAAQLFIPAERYQALAGERKNSCDTAALTVHAERMTPEPAPEHYRQAVDQALEMFETTALDKVVLARALRVDTQAPLDVSALMQRLLSINPQGYNFALPNDATADGKGSTFLGASPELLIRREGSRVIANPLAGSLPRSADADEDQRRAQALNQSDKDLREHALVVDAIVEALRPLCRYLDVPDGPEVIGTDRMWHLSTTLEGELADPNMTSLGVAAALHPTPAVCGAPWRDAHRAIKQLEGFERGYFTGLVGWCDEQGDGEWAIAIRCAEVTRQCIRVFAGAGVVPGSTAQGELDETAAKMRTMLGAMGLDYEDNPSPETARPDDSHAATDTDCSITVTSSPS